jgi:hypothetical protein
VIAPRRFDRTAAAVVAFRHPTVGPAQGCPVANRQLTAKENIMAISRKALLVGVALALAMNGVWAQDVNPPGTSHDMDKMTHEGMKGMNDANVQGMHTMPATITTIDSKTGIVDVNAGGMALKVHFLPASIASLKAGDHITLHMGFSK